MGEAADAPVLVEIDGDDLLVDDFLRQERGLFGLLRDVVEHLAVDRGDGRGRAENDEHLLLRGADRHLLERAFRDDVAARIGLGDAGSAAGSE